MPDGGNISRKLNSVFMRITSGTGVLLEPAVLYLLGDGPELDEGAGKGVNLGKT